MRTTKQIEIVLTKAEPVKSVLTECYMTALINVITYDAAYSVSIAQEETSRHQDLYESSSSRFRLSSIVKLSA